MEIYIAIVAVLRFAVDFLLLSASNHLCGCPMGGKRMIIAALIGGIYGGACLLSGFRFLGNLLWLLVSIGVESLFAFGWTHSSSQRAAVYALLRMAMNGITVGTEENGLCTLLLSSALLIVLCIFGLRSKIETATYIPIELNYRGKSISLTALRDTGNTLRDPVTGRSVLVVGADTADALIGLSKEQLSRPVETVCSGFLPGLRLIPYRSIERTGGLLVALCMHEVKIGSWKGSSLVAFAPVMIGVEGVYQALTGG